MGITSKLLNQHLVILGNPRQYWKSKNYLSMYHNISNESLYTYTSIYSIKILAKSSYLDVLTHKNLQTSQHHNDNSS